MGMYAYDELFAHWKSERITTEQAIGHMLQHIGAIYERLRVLERRISTMTTTATGAAQTSPTEEQKRQ